MLGYKSSFGKFKNYSVKCADRIDSAVKHISDLVSVRNFEIRRHFFIGVVDSSANHFSVCALVHSAFLRKMAEDGLYPDGLWG